MMKSSSCITEPKQCRFVFAHVESASLRERLSGHERVDSTVELPAAVPRDFVIGQLGPGVVTEKMRNLVGMSVLCSETSNFSLLRRNTWTFDLISSISSFGPSPSPKGVTDSYSG